MAKQVWTGKYVAQCNKRPIDMDVLSNSLCSGVGSVIGKVLAGRMTQSDVVTPTLSALEHPARLPDIEAAALRTGWAVSAGEKIAIVTDHDVDGVTSHAIIKTFLLRVGVKPENILSYIGHRLTEGYGLSESLSDRIIAADELPDLLITADCGSSDEKQIKKLSDLGVDVIVTDHHEIPEKGIPESAFAVISPARNDSQYSDKAIAGCMVAWLFMCQTRIYLNESTGSTIPTLTDLLDFVALGTVADCVTLAHSENNRAVVRRGLELISIGARPCWRSSRSFLGEKPELSATDLAFGIAPRINARGRLDEAMAGVKFLMSETDGEASEYVTILNHENDQRKAIEKRLLDSAIGIAQDMVSKNYVGLALWLPDGHPGVHGIIASRIVERFGAPVACISPHTTDTAFVSGSVRSVNGTSLNIKLVLDQVFSVMGEEKMPKHGGHAGAGGFTLSSGAVQEFIDVFDTTCKQHLHFRPGPSILCDGELQFNEINYRLLERIKSIEPYGRGFEEGIFELNAEITSIKQIGRDKNHLSLTLNGSLRAVWFNVNLNSPPISLCTGSKYQFLISLSENHFRGNTTIQAIIQGVTII